MPEVGVLRGRRRWTRRRWKRKLRFFTYAIGVVSLIVVAVTAGATVRAIADIGGDGKVITIKGSCSPGTSCHLISWGFFAFVPIACTIVYLLYRLWLVRRKYQKHAYKHAARLLDTELLSSKIVGRDDLCDILQKDLEARWEAPDDTTARYRRGPAGLRAWLRKRRQPRARRAIVLVGGVGSGKTAVLARLTQRLSERRAVPVPIRLRSAQDDETLDLLELARKQFMSVAEVRSDAEADKIWRRLHDNDQIVIVADGLEEALMGVMDTRETSIRAAFERIRRQGVAMIVSTRPHAALRHLDVATVKLEPLDTRDALRYITGVPDGTRTGTNGESDEAKTLARVEDIVRCTELVDMPIFMHIARELYEADRLKNVDARGVDRLGMRVRLIDRWMNLLAAGKIRPAAPVPPDRRASVIAKLEAIAAFGLMHDSLEVKFKDYTDTHDGDALAPDGDQAKELLDTTTQQLRETAADGDRLGLVDARADGVRFRHSITQAYLGSRRFSGVLAGSGDEDGKADKLLEQLERNLRKPGRELLMALAMSCAAQDEKGRIRAIRLLLRNVVSDGSVEKEKSVYTAAAVVTAASASTDRLPSVLPGDGPGVTVSPYKRRSQLREQVILWLTRAECEDATEFAAAARRAADDTRDSRDRTQARVERAELRLDERKDARDQLRAQASGHLRDLRLAAAEEAVVRAETEFRNARVAWAKTHGDHGAAHADAAVASAILAEKKLAEAEAEPGAAGATAQRRFAVECLERAIKDENNAREERQRAAVAEAEAYREGQRRQGGTQPAWSDPPGHAGAEPVRVSRLTERVVADVLVSREMLVEAAGAPKSAQAGLLEAARTRLADVLRAPRWWMHLREAANEVARSAAEPHERLRLVRQQAPCVASKMCEDKGAKEDAALRAEIELTLRAVWGASDALAELGAQRLDEAVGKLDIVSKGIDELGDDHWIRLRVDTAPLALAAAKAIHARSALRTVEEEPARDQPELRKEILENLSSVSHHLEQTSREGTSNGQVLDPRRATSRGKVLAPLMRADSPSAPPAYAAEGLQAAKLEAIDRLADASQFVWLWDVCKAEPNARVRMYAAGKLGGGGYAVFKHIARELGEIVTAGEGKGDPAQLAVDPERGYELIGWMLPLLYASVGRDESAVAVGHDHRALLDRWIAAVPKLSVRSGVALAEGLRFAANEPDGSAEHEGFLMSQVEDLLRKTSFWFTKVVLLQAFTLWLLSHGRHDGPTAAEMQERLSTCCTHPEHPLVGAAIELCGKAIQEGVPANYLWLDERAVTAKLGASEAAVRANAPSDPPWIPRTAGWLSLAPRAQQLLADVVIFMNMLDRGDDMGVRRMNEFLKPPPAEGEDGQPPRLAQKDLPLCLAARGGRAMLEVGRTLDQAVGPGANCNRAGCNMRLCPYPGLGEQLSRGELSEAFCRRQHELVSRRKGKRPVWQREASYDELRRFWRTMERRPSPR
jgi:hypothetical protein